jgi:hypothetical protein
MHVPKLACSTPQHHTATILPCHPTPVMHQHVRAPAPLANRISHCQAIPPQIWILRQHLQHARAIAQTSIPEQQDGVVLNMNRAQSSWRC